MNHLCSLYTAGFFQVESSRQGNALRRQTVNDIGEEKTIFYTLFLRKFVACHKYGVYVELAEAAIISARVFFVLDPQKQQPPLINLFATDKREKRQETQKTKKHAPPTPPLFKLFVYLLYANANSTKDSVFFFLPFSSDPTHPRAHNFRVFALMTMCRGCAPFSFALSPPLIP